MNRRTFAKASGLTATALASSAPAQKLAAPRNGWQPFLTTSDPNLSRAFRIACGDLRSNIVPWPAITSLPIPLPAKKWETLSQRIIQVAGTRDVIPSPLSFLLSGLDYGLYSFDVMMHAWDGASFLHPEAVTGSLLANLLPDDRGLRADYWISGFGWTLGAWQHYLCTGNRPFLKVALTATLAAFEHMEREEFDAKLNLFRGAAVIGDGISSYPDFWVKDTPGVGHIRKWPEHHPEHKVPTGMGLPMHVLSTNCVNYQAYVIAALMQRELGLPVDTSIEQKAARLKAAINQHFWREDAGLYRYIVDPFGGSDQQEGFGNTFAVLFGIASPEQTRRIFDGMHITPHGIPLNWPVYPRYASADSMSFGNHNATVWPPVCGLWAEAAARHGHMKQFAHELKSMADRACRDNQFAEIYHPVTGEIYGGIQESRTARAGLAMRAFVEARLGGTGEATPEALTKLFPPEAGKPGINRRQACGRNTFSATAFLRTVLHGLIGIRMQPSGLTFQPCVPPGLGPIVLQDLPYRGALLQIEITGAGQTVRKLTTNGREAKSLPATATGNQVLKIEVVS